MLDHPLSRFSRTRRYVLAVGHSLSIHTGVNHSIYLHNDHGLKRDHRERVCWMNLLGTTDSNSLIPTQASAEEMNQRVGPLKCNIATNASIFFFLLILLFWMSWSVNAQTQFTPPFSNARNDTQIAVTLYPQLNRRKQFVPVLFFSVTPHNSRLT